MVVRILLAMVVSKIKLKLNYIISYIIFENICVSKYVYVYCLCLLAI